MKEKNSSLPKKSKKQIKDEKWEAKHIPAPTKRELKLKEKIEKLEGIPAQSFTSQDAKKLKKYKKKYKYLHDQRYQPPKNNKTLSCCLTSVLVLIVFIIGGFFGGTYFLYENYGKPYAGVSYFDAWKMFFGLYGAQEEKLVSNPYNLQEDSNAFFKGLQTSLYLDKVFNIDDFLALIPKEEGGTGETDENVEELVAKGNPPQMQEPSGDLTTGNTFLDDLLENARFDFSSLKDYDGTQKTEFFITDKMLAAVIQQALLSEDKIEKLASAQDTLGTKISNVITVKQSIIKVDKNDVATVKLTIQLKVKELIKALLETQGGNLPKIAKSLIGGIVPKEIYISTTITPNVQNAPAFSINSIDDTLVRTVLTTADKATGGSIMQTLNSVGKTIVSVFDQINEFVGVNGMKFLQTKTEGGISLDSLQMTMRVMGVKNVTSRDFLSMIKHLHSIDLSGMTEQEYIGLLENLSRPEDFEISKNQLLASYGVSSEDAKLFTMDNFAEKLPDLPQYINIKGYVDEKTGKHLYENTNEQLMPLSTISDRALAQIFNEYLNKPAEEQNAELPFKMKVLELTLDGKSINLIAAIDLHKFLEDFLAENNAGGLTNLISSLFPKQLYVKIITPYERDLTEGAISSDVIFNYIKDETNPKDSNDMLTTLEKIVGAIAPNMANTFNRQELCKNIDKNIYMALDELNKATVEGEKSIVTATLSEGYVQISTVYEALVEAINKEEDLPEEKVTVEQLYIALNGFYNYNEEVFEFDDNGIPVDNITPISLEGNTGLIERELEKKMFLKNTPDPITNVKPINNSTIYEFMENFDANISAENIDNTMEIDKFINCKEPASSKNIALTSNEFGKVVMLSNKMDDIKKQFEFYENIRLISLSTDGVYLKATLAGELNKNYVLNDEEAAKIKIENIAADYIMLETTMLLENKSPDEESDLILNKTSNIEGDQSLNILLKVINKLSNLKKDEPLTSKTISDNLVKFVDDTFQTFEDQNITLKATDDISGNPANKVDGFTSDNIYKIVANKITNKYVEGDDERLRGVVYKLNNLYTADGDSTPFVSEHQAEMLTTEIPPEFEVTGNISNFVLTAQVCDVYIGKLVKAEVEKTEDGSSPNLIVTKFGALQKSSGICRQFATRLGEPAVAEYDNCDTLSMTIKLQRSMFGASELVNKFLPNEIYANIFVNLEDTSKILQFINNLTYGEGSEMEYLTRVTANADGSSPININVDKAVQNALNTNINILGQAITIATLYANSVLVPTTFGAGYGMFDLEYSML